MSKIRQKIKVGQFQVVIVNMEAQGKVIVNVVDKNGKSLGELRISWRYRLDGKWKD